MTLAVALAGLSLCVWLVWTLRYDMAELFYGRPHWKKFPKAVQIPAGTAGQLSVPDVEPIALDGEPVEHLLQSAEAAVAVELKLARRLDTADGAASDAKRIRRRAMELAVILRRLRAQMSHG